MSTIDVVIVGGSYAGLAAAMQLGRARRSVLVVDAGQRRNQSVSHAHGILGHDGESPAVIAAKGKEQVLAYPSVRWLDGAITETRASHAGFSVSAGDAHVTAKRLILATGVVDDVAPIPGLRERWGRTVFHCPYCDGYELDRGKLGVLAAGPVATHYATIVAEWGKPGETTLFLNEGTPLEASERAQLASRRIHVESEAIAEATDAPAGIRLLMNTGRVHDLAGVFVVPHTHLPGGFAEQLGCEVETGPVGSMYKTDARTKETTVKGVFACGDAALPLSSVSFAIADGARAGAFAHQSLVFER